MCVWWGFCVRVTFPFCKANLCMSHRFSPTLRSTTRPCVEVACAQAKVLLKPLENPKKPKTRRLPSKTMAKTIGKTKKPKKPNSGIESGGRQAQPPRDRPPPLLLQNLFFFVFFVFPMVLAIVLDGSLRFFCFFWFSNGFSNTFAWAALQRIP